MVCVRRPNVCHGPSSARIFVVLTRTTFAPSEQAVLPSQPDLKHSWSDTMRPLPYLTFHLLTPDTAAIPYLWRYLWQTQQGRFQLHRLLRWLLQRRLNAITRLTASCIGDLWLCQSWRASTNLHIYCATG